MSKKKYQIFISSTYIDLKEERQAAVEAILGSKHIPAGMELFRAGNKSQLETIKKWINESDIYMLILGGRYGSIERQSGKSYTQLEYEYAIEKKIPVFAVVLKEKFLYEKASSQGNDVITDTTKEEYKEFKSLVMSKMVKEVEDCKDIQLAVKDSISELEEEHKLVGWIRASEVEDCTKIIKENNKLLKENNKLKEEINKINKSDKIGKFDYEKLKEVLRNKTLKIPDKYLNDNEEVKMSYLEFILRFKNQFITGITNKNGVSKLQSYFYHKLSPFLVSIGLLEINKISGVQYRRIEMSKLGLEFVARLEAESLENKKNND